MFYKLKKTYTELNTDQLQKYIVIITIIILITVSEPISK